MASQNRNSSYARWYHKESDGEGPRPNIAYIDEIEDARDNFFNDAYDSGLFAKIYRVEPLQSIEEMLAFDLSLDIDALIADFNLTEAAPLE